MGKEVISLLFNINDFYLFIYRAFWCRASEVCGHPVPMHSQKCTTSKVDLLIMCMSQLVTRLWLRIADHLLSFSPNEMLHLTEPHWHGLDALFLFLCCDQQPCVSEEAALSHTDHQMLPWKWALSVALGTLSCPLIGVLYSYQYLYDLQFYFLLREKLVWRCQPLSWKVSKSSLI